MLLEDGKAIRVTPSLKKEQNRCKEVSLKSAFSYMRSIYGDSKSDKELEKLKV